MAYTALPTWPLILFGILEPVALIWGYSVTLLNPESYFLDQVPNTTLASVAGHLVPVHGLALTYQLGNVFIVLAAVAIICTHTTHTDIIKKYLLAIALGDLGHIYACYRTLETNIFWDITQWNDMAWGNIFVSAFLHVNRLATVAGLFGKVVSNANVTKKNK
ncbi:uncharacterized protein A1O9_06367 [Exophiala aquamarina CBS 119918]|uniref:DUF7704 domain-containing protein n=1 Tax=Exophiala aquamarina CBS 119918 TaxID=1182545 RepID=A0A072PEY7_9EURO|nr:uncharacterized protein A1O9_06367 [Exophiala aquamarina CBS 119918]KEF58441.1 hypothetical protein A1O9_06367 [Exophiala aquamarina CBS 119918]